MASNPRFERPGALMVEYCTPREGPSGYLIWMPNFSTYATTRTDLLKIVNWSKTLTTGAALRAWLDEIEAQEAPTPEPEQLNTSSWGPEAHEVVLTDIEPNDQTKMIT